MERPQAEWLIEFLEKAGKLKSVPRHCITPEGVRETVAGHCWRVSLMAWLLKEELPDVDMEKVIHMCLLHDLGEAVTGDIPAFEKKEQDRSVERKAVDGLLSMLPGKTGEEAKVLFAEMNALKTEEAKVYKALDKLEAVIAHNESNISTWLPLEYELQQTYAAESVKGFPILEEIQRLAVEKTLEKIAEEKAGRNPEEEKNNVENSAEPTGDQAADAQSSAVVPLQPDKPLSGKELRRQKKEAAAAQKAEAAAQKAREKAEAEAQKARQKEESLAAKLQRRQEKKEYRQGVRQERGQEIRLLWHIVEFIMLVTFIVLAIDQVGLYGFLFVWFFIALAAASIVLLLAGLIRAFRKKRAGIMILVSLIGIIGCIAWFIFLVSSKLI